MNYCIRRKMRLGAAAGKVGLSVLVAGLCLSCDRQNKVQTLDSAYAYAIKSAQDVLKNWPPDATDYGVKGWQEDLALLQARQVSESPHMILAEVAQDKDSGKWTLYLQWLELDNDSYGVRFTERDSKTGKSLVEEYPLPNASREFQASMKGIYHLTKVIPFLPVSVRSAGSKRESKDEAKWKEWDKSRKEDSYPPAPIWVTLPPQGKNVEVTVFDVAGHESQPVVLHVAGEGQAVPAEKK
jgi:hypothetical protein